MNQLSILCLKMFMQKEIVRDRQMCLSGRRSMEVHEAVKEKSARERERERERKRNKHA